MNLRMVVTLLPDSISVVLTDDGRPVAVDLSQTAMPGEWSDRGRGLAIAHRVPLGGDGAVEVRPLTT